PDFSAFFFGAILLLLAMYGAHMGLEAAARAALPVLVVFAAAMLLTALGVREEIRLIHLRPVEGVPEIFRAAAKINPLPELLIFLTAAPKASGRRGKVPALLWAFGLSAVLFSMAALLCGLVLGGLQRETVYSFFKVETIMRLSIFQRMDAWFLAMWIFVLFIRALFLLWSAEQLLSPLTVKGRRLLLPVLGAGALAVSLLLLRQDALSRQLMRCIENGWWLTAVFILLAAALLCRKGRKRS
ncbi:MAG: GerAB/ArcD/ProY family transporter, partial [Oscillospiraceae bacterium]|nr:GerAB/ArcD/ProY family transporter [Oscillospiraceae bacterium]